MSPSDHSQERHWKTMERERARARRRRQELHEKAAGAVFQRRFDLAARYRGDAKAIEEEWR